ncbi:MAG: hypothetical protein LQ342_004809 [Letrouitia transgressa]|nr:MAG: hypothetical protein LQ342_004809 [Letrouitia transgressa]
MSNTQRRLNQVKDMLTMNKPATTIPFDPDCTIFPNRRDVPRRDDALPEAAWVWGENDYVRTMFINSSDIRGPNANKKCSIHYLAEHGIAGRGVLLDYRAYANKKGLQYSSFTDHRIPYEELYLCGQDQGLDIRPEAQGGDIKIGDLLFIRTGFVEAYNNIKSSEEWAKLALREHEIGPNDGQKWAGVAQEEAVIDWLHDCYFAAVAGDAPAFEAWPTNKEYLLHEYLLAMWGCPIGEMLDLEKLAKKCREYNKWTFFLTSSPANVHGGVSSHVNGIAIL